MDDQPTMFSVLKDARAKYGLPEVEIHSSKFNEFARADIPVLLARMEPKDFYLWFCQLWQCFEVDAFYESTEEEIARGVGALATGLTENPAGSKDAFQHPSLRAMCMSFMMNGLQTHVLAQSYALRMLLLFAKGTDLCKQRPFVAWILKFMQSRIDSMIGIKDKQDLFVRVCVGFFQAIPADQYDTNCLLAILRFFGSPEFRKVLENPGKDKEALYQVATATLNAALTQHREFFLFEIIQNTHVIFANLDDRQREILQIFAEKKLKDFNDLLAAGTNTYIQDVGLALPTLTFNMQVLTFCTICHGKTQVNLADLQTEFELQGIAMKKLLVTINRTNVAKTQIDAVNGVVYIDYCQPRLFTDETWAGMERRLGDLITSLENTSRTLDVQ
jgi:hypothetical protein